MKFLIFLLSIALTNTGWAQSDPSGLTNETGLGYVVTGGNSQSETTSITEKLTQVWTKDILRFTGHYIQAEGFNPSVRQTVQTAENWSAAARFERVIDPKIINVFVGHGWYGNRFQGVREGHNTDIGAKYYTSHSDVWVHSVELGYRYTRELLTGPAAPDVGVGSRIMPEFHYVRAFTQGEYHYSKTSSIGAWVEYLPSITDFKYDQRINYSPYMLAVLTDILSLKVAYEGRYRFKPAVEGKLLTDYTFTTSLIAKF